MSHNSLFHHDDLAPNLKSEEIPAFSKNLDFLAFESHMRNTLSSLLEPINQKYNSSKDLFEYNLGPLKIRGI